MLNYKQIWHGIKPIRWLNKFNLTNLYPTNTRVVDHGSEVREGMVWQWGEMRAYSRVPTQILLGVISCWDDILPKKSKMSWNHGFKNRTGQRTVFFRISGSTPVFDRFLAGFSVIDRFWGF